MKKAVFLLALCVMTAPAAFTELPRFAGGSFSTSFQDASSFYSGANLSQISFSGYGYASLTDDFFLGGFGEGFGGQDTTSGYGGLALGVILDRADSVWYLLSFTGVGLLGYRNDPRFGVLQEMTLNYATHLSRQFLFSVYFGANLQTNLSGRAFTEYLSVAPVLGARIDFGDLGRFGDE
jgi:hypothetical protein